MTSILFDKNSKTKSVEPVIAGILSAIPGLGQFCNGKTKKGALFLFATFISILMLYSSINPSFTLAFAMFFLGIVKFIVGFIFNFDFKPSPAANFIMESIKFGGSFSILLVFTIIGFVIYSMIDAYMDAEKTRQVYEYKIISTDSTMFQFSESTAGSYIIHCVVFISLFLASLFLVIPRAKEHVTEIEFILPQVESKKPPPPETTRRSTVQSIDQGKHNPNKPVTPAQPTRPVSPPPNAPPRPVPMAIQPMIAPPQPVAPPEPQQIPRPVPKAVNRPALTQAAPQPAPIQNSQTSEQNKLPGPQAPAPEAPSSEHSDSPSQVVAVAPKVPGSGGIGGFGSVGNPPPNSRPTGPTSLAAKKDVDFGPYMNDLQRRIKRAWKPPRGNESKRVVVMFKINRAGQLSDLAIKKNSGFEPSNQAALLAVQAAAPFGRLPEGAPPVIDIEFTFDYNVFGASGYR